MVDNPAAQGEAASFQAAIDQLTGVVAGMAGQMQLMQARLEATAAAAGGTGGAGVPAEAPGTEVQVPAATSVPSKNPKLKFPQPFDGSSTPGAVETFIFDCEMYFEGMEIPAEKQEYVEAE